MRIFVVGTGRCGSVTFYKACAHITNYTAGHEWFWRMEPGNKLEYPDNHIEVAHELSIAIPLLRDLYDPDVRFVHLIRQRDMVVTSWGRWQTDEGEYPMHHWGQFYYSGARGKAARIAAAGYHYDVTMAIVPALLEGANYMTINLEDVTERWGDFWHWIEAEGDIDAARLELSYRHNAYNGER